ncbi:hypothetical protein P3S67_018045 [Capsicum chacoense]
MHIEKNIFDNIIFTLLNYKEKPKDHVKARKDLQAAGIRHDIWVDENDECKLATFVIPKNKKVAFLKTLKNISVPDGYSTLFEKFKSYRLRQATKSNCGNSLAFRDFVFSFIFTVMIHLIVHLVDVVKKGGPVHYRWMYFVERLLGHFKSLKGNKSQPEGFIAESYIVGEALALYSCYFEEIESRLNRPKCLNDEPKPLTHLEKTQAHRYVLLNCAAVKPFIDEFRDYIKRSTRGRRLSATEVERRVSKEFPDWFPKRMKHAIQADLPYYGKLEDIVELNYYGKFRVVLFKCQWADTTQNRGFKIDAWKFNCVNFSKLIHTGDCMDDDPYIEASHDNMVYYVDDENDEEWCVAVHLKPRDLFDIGEIDEEKIYENEPYQQQEFRQFFDVDYENCQRRFGLVFVVLVNCLCGTEVALRYAKVQAHEEKQKSDLPIATSQGTESTCLPTNLPPLILHAPQPSRPVYSASHPTPMDQDTLHPGSTVWPESQPSQSVHSTSHQGLANQDSSQLSRSIHSTSHSDPTNENSSQASPKGQDAPKKHPRRESNLHWVVDAIDSRNNVKKIKVKAKEVLNLTGEERIMVKFDIYDKPFGEAHNLFSGFCEILACDCSLFPINFEKWSNLPVTFFNRVFDLIIKEKIESALSQSTTDESQVSPNDVVGKVLGQEHFGRVRCLGLGVVPSRVFQQVRPRFGGTSASSNGGSCSFQCRENYNQMMNSHNQILSTLKAYMIMKEGTIPE